MNATDAEILAYSQKRGFPWLFFIFFFLIILSVFGLWSYFYADEDGNFSVKKWFKIASEQTENPDTGALVSDKEADKEAPDEKDKEFVNTNEITELKEEIKKRDAQKNFLVILSWKPPANIAHQFLYKSTDGGKSWGKGQKLPPKATQMAQIELPLNTIIYKITTKDKEGNESKGVQKKITLSAFGEEIGNAHPSSPDALPPELEGLEDDLFGDIPLPGEEVLDIPLPGEDGSDIELPGEETLPLPEEDASDPDPLPTPTPAESTPTSKTNDADPVAQPTPTPDPEPTPSPVQPNKTPTPTVAKDTTPPENIRNLSANYTARINDYLVNLKWSPSLNTAGDLQNQLLYRSTNSGKNWNNGQSLGKNTTNTSKSEQPQTRVTYKITTKDTSGNESTGIMRTISLPKLAESGTGDFLLVSLAFGALVRMFMWRRRVS